MKSSDFFKFVGQGVAMLFLGLVMVSVSALANNYSVSGFIANQGQWPSEVLFANKQPNMITWVTKTGLVFDQYSMNKKTGSREGNVVRMTWEGGASNPLASASGGGRSVVNFFKGSDRSGWYTNVPVYNNVRVADVYPGIDAVYYIDNNFVRYDLDVRSGAAVSKIELAFAGDEGIEVSGQEIRLKTPVGSIVMTDLFAYFFGQRSLNTHAEFVTTPRGVKFSVPSHDGTKPLTIDPLVYGTYIGGPDNDVVCGVEVTTANVVVAGTTTGFEFPSGTGKYSDNSRGEEDAFVALMDKSLRRVTAYTYVGGSSPDVCRGIALDKEGNVYITGETSSNDFPTTIGAAGQLYKAQIDAFVVKFNPTLTTLMVGTYIGGNKDDMPKAIVVDNSNNIIIAGATTSNANFPTTLAHQSVFGGTVDCFLAKLSPNGSTFIFCTYYGKAGVDYITGITLDADGAPFVTGSTASSDFETAPTPGRWSSGRVPYDRTFNGGNTDAFLIKFFPDGTLSKRDDGTFATFFGGNADDEGRGVWVDALGRAVLIGVTTSTNLPTVGTLFPAKIGQQDIFMAVFTDDGRALTSCTYYGGLGMDNVIGVKKDPAGSLGIIYGSTSSSDFPTVGTGSSDERRGASDGFIASVNTLTNKFCSLVGGSAADTVTGIAVEPNGDIYISLASLSDDLYVSDMAYKGSTQGGSDGHISKFAFGTIAMQSPSGGEQICMAATTSITWQTTDMYENDKYTLEISNDAGSSWTVLVADLTTKAFSWKPTASLAELNSYRIRVLSPRGHVSSSASFSLVKSPGILTQPSSTAACSGKPISLSVVAEGAGLKYQWRKNGVTIPGATKATYDIASADMSSAGKYEVVVNGQCSPNVTSVAVDLTITNTTTISKQPADVTVEEANAIVLSVEASGGNLTYQWQKNGADVSGATSSTYTITSAKKDDAGTYLCKINGGCGGEVVSESATVVVTPTSSVNEDLNGDVSELSLIGPNPASDEIHISASFINSGVVSARFVDSHGRVMLEVPFGFQEAGSQVFNLSVASLPIGVYGLEVTMNSSVLRVAAVVNR